MSQYLESVSDRFCVDYGEGAPNCDRLARGLLACLALRGMDGIMIALPRIPSQTNGYFEPAIA